VIVLIQIFVPDLIFPKEFFKRIELGIFRTGHNICGRFVCEFSGKNRRRKLENFSIHPRIKKGF